MTNSLVATSTGFSGAAVLAAVSQEGFTSWLMAALSVGATVTAWFIARRTELSHARLAELAAERETLREQQRLDAEARRAEQLADLIQLITARRCTMDADKPVPTVKADP